MPLSFQVPYLRKKIAVMKKTLLTLFVLCAIAGNASGQFYLNLGMGYAVPAAGNTMDGTGTPYNGTINGNNYSMKNASFATGLWGNIGVGYMGGANIGIQLDANIGLSNTKYTFNNNNVVLPISPGPVYGNESTIQHAATPLLIMPSFVIQSGGDPINFYGRLGIALPLNTKITQDVVMVTAAGAGAQEVLDFSYQIKNSFSLGYTAAVGIQYKLNDRVKLWGEVSLLSMSLYIKESDFKNLTVDGNNQNSSYRGPLVTKYSKNVNVDTVNYTQLPAYSQPFSNMAFNVGISFRLSEKKERHSKHIRSDNARLREERGE
jgi:hypothetical protein